MDSKFKELTILLVEDDSSSRSEISIILTRLIRNVYTVSSELDAINLYIENKSNIDLILCSMNNSGTGALELLKQVRLHDKKLSFIMLLENFETYNLIESIKYNVSDILPKPIVIKDLLVSIYNACENKFTFKEKLITTEEVQSYIDALNKVAIVSKTDLKGTITYVNDIFCEIAQYTKDELIGKPHNIVRHPDMPKKAFEELWDNLKNGKKWQGKVKNRAKDGSEYFVNATISPLYDALGENIIGYIGIRFLTTDDENEKREFQKKVIVNLKNTKKREFELINKIEYLEKYIDSTKYLNKELEYEQMRSLKLVNQLNHYEKDMQQIEVKNNQLITNINLRISEISKSRLELKEKNEKLSNITQIQEKLIKENIELIQSLENKLSEQAKKIEDLMDVILHRESEILKLKKIK
jgi:PAS domain S-box-containing protein